MSPSSDEIIAEVRGGIGMITLNRPQALNALSVNMVRGLYATLRAWQKDESVLAVALRGNGRQEAFGVFCAGGDIRAVHAAALAGGAGIMDFFTDEYRLNHLTHHFGKPYIAFMDGIVMGGGMGISQGGTLRIVTERTRMAMPETLIGFFPDVGGGYFLSRSPGRTGEWLGLTGASIGAGDAIALGLADGFLPSARQAFLWEQLASHGFADSAAVEDFVRSQLQASTAALAPAPSEEHLPVIERCFGESSVAAIESALLRESGAWAHEAAAALRQRSPLMLHVVLEQIRRARAMSLAEDLRMELGLVHHCFFPRHGWSEAVEGIRALAVDKDRQPRWQPASIEQVDEAQWQAFFAGPWAAARHPLSDLA